MANDYGDEPRLPAIPDVPPGSPLASALAILKEWVEVRQGARGSGLDRAVTIRDLLNAGLADPAAFRGLFPGGLPPEVEDPDDSTDPDIPPTPTDLEASGAIRNIILTWKFASGYSRLAYFEVWRSVTNALGDAAVIAQTYATTYADEVGAGAEYYYWVRARSDVAFSPFNSVSGTLGKTSLDVEHVLDVLTGQITESQLYVDLGARIDLIDGPWTLPGSVDARVLTETTARISGDNAIIVSTNTQFAVIDDTFAVHQSQITTTANDLEALASDVTTLEAVVGDNTTAIQTETTARINADGSINSKYSVKIDTNGYVTGFGLISEANVDETPFSSFIIRADSFSIASPSGPTITPTLPFIVRTTETVINGVTVPVGIYMTDSYIQNGTIVNAKIGNLAVDDAKIANMNVAKLTAGSIAVGEYIQSTGFSSGSTGFRISGNGNAEFNNVTARGTVYATAGELGGNTINSTGMQSPGYNGTTGWRINSDGTATFGNTVTFKGALSGATGTFSGSLSAATGTFAGSLSAAGGTFSGDLSAAGGTFSGTLTAAAVNAVDTLNVAGNAITGLSAADGGSNTIPSGGSVTLCSTNLTMPSGGSGVVISITVALSSVSNSSQHLLVYKDGSQMTGTGISLTGGFADNGTFTCVDPSPTVGTSTYSFVARNPTTGPGSNVAATVTSSAIVVSGAKR